MGVLQQTPTPYRHRSCYQSITERDEAPAAGVPGHPGLAAQPPGPAPDLRRLPRADRGGPGDRGLRDGGAELRRLRPEQPRRHQLPVPGGGRPQVQVRPGGRGLAAVRKWRRDSQVATGHPPNYLAVHTIGIDYVDNNLESIPTYDMIRNYLSNKI